MKDYALRSVHRARMSQKVCAIMHYYAHFLRLYIIEQINQIVQNKPNKTYARICPEELCTFLHYWGKNMHAKTVNDTQNMHNSRHFKVQNVQTG